MTDQTPTAPRRRRRRGSLGQSCSPSRPRRRPRQPLIWSALFYNATNQHAAAVAATPAPAAQAGAEPAEPRSPHTAPAPVTTRTS